MKTNTNSAATITNPDPIQNGNAGFILYNAAPPRNDTMAPTPPMKLTMPFACDRYAEGVMSGMRATTGVRQRAMLNSRVLVQATNNGKTAARGISPKAKAPTGAPMRMNGIRRPIGVGSLSDHAPEGGWMSSAAMLYSVIKKPMSAGCRLNLLARKSGTNALYTPQMTLTPKKPKPSKKIF